MAESSYDNRPNTADLDNRSGGSSGDWSYTYSRKPDSGSNKPGECTYSNLANDRDNTAKSMGCKSDDRNNPIAADAVQKQDVPHSYSRTDSGHLSTLHTDDRYDALLPELPHPGTSADRDMPESGRCDNSPDESLSRADNLHIRRD